MMCYDTYLSIVWHQQRRSEMLKLDCGHRRGKSPSFWPADSHLIQLKGVNCSPRSTWCSHLSRSPLTCRAARLIDIRFLRSFVLFVKVVCQNQNMIKTLQSRKDTKQNSQNLSSHFFQNANQWNFKNKILRSRDNVDDFWLVKKYPVSKDD